MGSIKPLDESFLAQCAKKNYKMWISLEEHHKSGGLGTCLLEWLADNSIDNIRLVRMGIDDKFIHKLGNQNYTRKMEGLDSKAIVELIMRLQ